VQHLLLLLDKNDAYFFISPSSGFKAFRAQGVSVDVSLVSLSCLYPLKMVEKGRKGRFQRFSRQNGAPIVPSIF